MKIFIFFYICLILYFLYVSFHRKMNDHIFSPWPGYVVVFSSYFLFGSFFLDADLTDSQWMMYSLALLGFAIPGIMFSKITKLYSHEDRAYFADDFVISYNHSYIILLSSIGLIFTLSLWYKSGIPFFSHNVDHARIVYASSAYLATLATFLDISAIFSACYLIVQSDKKSKFVFYLSCVIVIVFVFVAILSGSRSRVLKLIIPSLLLIHFLLMNIGIIKLMIISILGAAFVGLMGFYRAYTLYGDGVWQGLLEFSIETPFEAVLHYIKIELSTAVYGLSIVVDIIPNFNGHTFGLLFISPLLMPLPFNTPTPGMFYKELIGGTWDGAGLAATFIAPMYTDFSMLGVFVFSIFYGLFFNILYIKACSKSINNVYFVVVFSIAFFFMISGVRSDFVSFEFLWFMLVAFSMLVFKRKKVDHYD